MGKSTSVSKGLLWKLLERFGVSGAQFVLQIILARLLAPELYGVLSLMIIFTTIANVFVQHGFNMALVQNKDVDEEDFSSVLWVSLGIAGFLYGVIFFCAPTIAAFYEMPEIITPLRVLALMLFPGALNSVQVAKISREMNFRKVFFSNIIAIIVSGTVGIAIALCGGELWALVMQSMLNVFISCIVMRFTSRLKIKFVCNIARVKILFGFGWKILISHLIDTVYQDVRSLVIGKKYDNSTLGYYNKGKQFPQFLINSINSAIQSVMLPAMSAEQDDKVKVKSMMRTSMIVSSYIIFPMMAGLAAVSAPLVSILLTDKWLPCVPYLQIYCFTLAFYPVHTCNLQTINAMGRSDIFLKLEVIKKIVGISALVLVLIFFDSPIAIAMTGVFTTFISCFINAYPNKKLIAYSYLEQIKDILPSFLMAICMCIVVLLIGQLHINNFVLIFIQVLIGVVIYLLLSIIFRPAPFRFLIVRLKDFLKSKKSH